MRCAVLFLSAVLSAVSAAAYGHLDYGVPNGTNVHLRVYEKPAFALGFDEDRHQPHWVGYRLTADRLTGTNRVLRTNRFRTDPSVPYSATTEDYARSGYDRGHLCPAADVAADATDMDESFFMSNMSPQVPGFNRGVWKDLEAWVRQTAKAEGSVYVLTGPIFTDASTNAIGISRVTVPRAYYKIVLDETPPVKILAFILPNAETTTPFRAFTCPVATVERFSGLSFFSLLPEVLRTNLKNAHDRASWGFPPP